MLRLFAVNPRLQDDDAHEVFRLLAARRRLGASEEKVCPSVSLRVLSPTAGARPRVTGRRVVFEQERRKVFLVVVVVSHAENHQVRDLGAA